MGYARNYTTDATNFKYAVKPKGANYVVLKDGWLQEYSSTDAYNALSQCATLCNNKGKMIIRTGDYDISSAGVNGWDLSDITVTIEGELNPIIDNSTYGVKIHKTGRVLTVDNTGYPITTFKNLLIKADDDTAINTYIHNARERTLFNQVTIWGGQTVLKMAKIWYADNYDLRLKGSDYNGSAQKVLHLVNSGAGNEGVNTLNFYGGYINSGDINVYLDYTNQVNFKDVIIEGAKTNAVKTANSANGNKFSGCSFETNTTNNFSAGGDIINEASGVCNTYDKCRFDSDVDNNICNIASGSRGITFSNNMIQSNSAGKTATYVIASGALYCMLLGNREHDLTPVTQAVTDNEPTTIRIGNTNIQDKIGTGGITFGNNDIKIYSIDANTLGITQTSNTTNFRNFRINGLLCGVLRNSSSVDMITFNSGPWISVNTAIGFPVSAVSLDTTLGVNHNLVLVDASGANRTITLPASSGLAGRMYIIKKTDASANTVTIDGNASETIDGALTKVLSTQYEKVTIRCDGSNWHIVA